MQPSADGVEDGLHHVATKPFRVIKVHHIRVQVALRMCHWRARASEVWRLVGVAPAVVDAKHLHTLLSATIEVQAAGAPAPGVVPVELEDPLVRQEAEALPCV